MMLVGPALGKLPRWLLIGVLALTMFGNVVATIVGYRYFVARRSEEAEPTSGSHVPIDMLAPASQRRAYVFKAARLYSLAFAPESIQISPRLDSRRKAMRWAADYVAGSPVDVEHDISHSSIEAIVIRQGATVEIRTRDNTYVLDGWFNSFDMTHHAELLHLIGNISLEPVLGDGQDLVIWRDAHASKSPAPETANSGLRSALTSLLERDATTVSCGGGPNMFDMRSAEVERQHS